jgi:hypothetical protein
MTRHPVHFNRRTLLQGGAAAVALGAASPSLQAEEPSSPGFYTEPARQVPIVDAHDVVVCGAGPAGVAAAIAAARAGAKVRLLEARGCLGGVWTAGLLAWILDWRNKPGLMAEMMKRLVDARGAAQYGNDMGYLPERMKLLLEQMCGEAGVTIQFHTRVAAAHCQGGRLALVVTDSKSGRQAFAGKAFVDATGDGDLSAQAGCSFDYGREGTRMAQPMSMMAILVGLDPDKVARFTRGLSDARGHRVPKQLLYEEMQRAGVTPSYSQPTLFYLRDGLYCLASNHEYNVSAFSAADITAATLRARAEINRLVEALRAQGEPWNDVQIVATNEHIGVREGRRVRGHYQVTRDDLIEGAKHDDAVCKATFPVDVHSTDPAKDKGIMAEGVHARPYDIPFRALVAKDVTGLLMAGRCISGDFIAHSSYRVTGNAVPMGEAAGVAAALSAQTGRPPHELPWADIAAQLEEQRAAAAVAK